MSNRDDWSALVQEIFEAYMVNRTLDIRVPPAGPPTAKTFRERIETELHNAFVAGQEHVPAEKETDQQDLGLLYWCKQQAREFLLSYDQIMALGVDRDIDGKSAIDALADLMVLAAKRREEVVGTPFIVQVSGGKMSEADVARLERLWRETLASQDRPEATEGRHGFRQCSGCQGRGRVTREGPGEVLVEQCPACEGRGGFTFELSRDLPPLEDRVRALAVNVDDQVKVLHNAQIKLSGRLDGIEDGLKHRLDDHERAIKNHSRKLCELVQKLPAELIPVGRQEFEVEVGQLKQKVSALDSRPDLEDLLERSKAALKASDESEE